jgi:hypothetical protein
MAEVLDLTPAYAHVVGLAGDTATITILTTPPDATVGAVWSAQVRFSPSSEDVLEFFDITLVEGGACLTLSADQTAGLAMMGAIKRSRGCAVYQVFSGVWDAQTMWTDTGYVKTLVRGSLTIEMDVTR